MEQIYIRQYAEWYEGLEEFITGKARKSGFYSRSIQLDVPDLLNIKQLFIVAEPGYGKTTLIDQLQKYFQHNSIPFKYTTGLKNERPVLDPDTEYLIFDALDECSDIIPTFVELLKFVENSEVKLIITNRTHYISIIQHLLKMQDFQFVKLMPFTDYQIRFFLSDKLQGLNYTEEEIDQIISNSKGTSEKSVLRTPRYLNEFGNYILKDKVTPDQITSLNKTTLFEKVIYFKLEHDANTGQNSKYLTKRVLERLALVMEIQGLNQISMEDFITFLDQTDSNINLIFLNNANLEELLYRVMKPIGVMLQFEHTEFQEYLAAKELNRMGYRFQTVYDLMVDHTFGILRTNWIDVLTFAVELAPDFAYPLINFIQTNKTGNVEEKLIELLIGIPDKYFDNTFKDEFFLVVSNYYYSRGKMMYQTYHRLADYITMNRTDILTPYYSIETLNDSIIPIQGNQILLIQAMAEKGKLNFKDKSIWADFLTRMVLIDEYHAMQSVIFRAIGALDEPEVILGLIPEFEKKPDYILNNLVNALSYTAPNDPRTGQLIIRCLTLRRRVDNIDGLINRITDESRIIEFFKCLSGTLSILDSDRFRFGSGFYSLFDQIELLNSKKLKFVIYHFINNVFQHRKFVQQMTGIVDLSFKFALKHQRGFLRKMMAFPAFLQSIDVIIESLALDIDLNTFKQIERFVKSSPNKWRLDRVVYKMKHKLETIPEHEIYKYINKKYLVPWSKIPSSEKITPVKTAISELREYYVQDQTFYYTALIPTFVHKFDEVQSALIESDIIYLTQVIELTLNNYDPDKFELHIHDVTGNNTSFTHNDDVWFHIELYFKAAYHLGDFAMLKKYRIKFLKTIPRLDILEHKKPELIEKIVAVIGGINKDDQKLIYKFCLEKKDDMLALSGRSFAEIAVRLKITSLKQILLKLIDNKKVKVFEKQEILKAFGELSNTRLDQNALHRMFKVAENDQMKDIANSYLISKFSDPAAIDWRFEQLKIRAQKFDSDIWYNGARGVSDFERELEHPEFPKCLYGLLDNTVNMKMYGLLTFSFHIHDKKPFFSYSSYLQKIVYTYFKPIVNARIIADLRKVTAGFKVIEQTYSFNQILDKMVEELHQQKKSIEPFSSAIHSANHILSKAYLPIQSNQELKELILRIFKGEIRTLIEDDGLYRLTERLADNRDSHTAIVTEAIIQKTLKIALEKALLENGLRKSDIYREVESMDGKKYDYLISYGLFGPIVVELKLMHNAEITNPGKRKAYKPKLNQYLRANSNMGIYAVFQVYNNASDKSKYQQMVDQYKDLEGLDIVAMKCY